MVAALRARFPFELEWMEGAMIDEVRRVVAGEKIYVKPSLEYAPFIYGPLWFWVSAALTRVFGDGFFGPRLVSILATLATFALIFRIVRRETGGWTMGVVGAGLYAATYRRTLEFMDLARTDALAIALVLVAVDLLRARTSQLSRVAAAAFLVLGFLAKQSVLAIALALVVSIAVEDRRRAWPFVVSIVGGVVATCFALDAYYEGWFRFYVFELPSAHAIMRPLILAFWTDDLLAPFGLALVGASWALFGPGTLERNARRILGFALAGALATSWSSRMHSGGWPNVVLPAYALLAIVFAIGVHQALVATAGTAAERFVLIAAIAQLLALVYDPRDSVPSARERIARERLVARLAAVKGEVLVASHGDLTVRAGKRSFIHQMTYEDITRVPNGEVGNELRTEIAEAIRRKRFALIVVDNDFFAPELRAHYVYAGEAFDAPDVGWNRVGVWTRPGAMFVPRR